MAGVVVIAAGGTGGHVYPALAVAREIMELAPETEITFVGTATGLESRLVRDAGFRFQSVAASPWKRNSPATLVSGSLRAVRGAITASGILRRARVKVVFSTGGYVSAPTLLAAVIGRVPIVLHEPNAVPGVVTRIFSRWASVVTVGTESARRRVAGRRLRVTGVPVRRSLLESTREQIRRRFGIDDKTCVVIVMGGSQGSKAVNDAMAGALHRLESSSCPLAITWIRGGRETAPMPDRPTHPRVMVRVLEYVDDMGPLLREADLVVARAGASTVAELLAVGVPSILIPYPHAAEDHQRRNARDLAIAGATEVIEEPELTSALLAERILALAGDPGCRARMGEAARRAGRPDAARVIAAEVLGIMTGEGNC